MKTLRTTLFAVGFAALGSLATVGTYVFAGAPEPPAAGDCPYGGRGMHGGGMGPMGHMLDDLDLSDAQEKAFDGLRNELRGRWAEGREDRMSPPDLLEAVLKADKLDTKSLHKLVDTALEQHRELAYDFVDAIAEFVSTLSPEQKKLALEKVESFQGQRGQGKGCGHGMGGHGRHGGRNP
jgi:Spy/CpxP family protein refolding chaperone